jgi:hypothetical protein
MEEQPNYYAILTAKVRYDKELSPNIKLLYAEITSLSNLYGYCWATNKYFASLYDVSLSSVQKWISKLVEKKYINVQYVYKENSKEIEKRNIFLSEVIEKFTPPPSKNLPHPPVKNCEDNNTSINNKYNNIIEEIFKNNLDYVPLIQEWLMYKKEIKDIYKTERGFKVFCKKLLKLSGGNIQLGEQIINQSMDNEWKGIFELKNNSTYVKPIENKQVQVKPQERYITPYDQNYERMKKEQEEYQKQKNEEKKKLAQMYYDDDISPF